jgi:hypothetical protein
VRMCGQVRRQARAERLVTTVLEGLHDGAHRAVVPCGTGHGGDVRGEVGAPAARVIGPGQPAPAAQRRGVPRYGLPARITHRSRGGTREWPAARDARRRDQQRQRGIEQARRRRVSVRRRPVRCGGRCPRAGRARRTRACPA